MIWLGIDPGLSGGLAAIGLAIRVCSVPKTDRDVLNWFNWFCSDGSGSVVAIIEKVQGFIGTPHPGSAMFKFGKSYGGLCMALTAAKIPFEEVTPRVWQKALGIVPRGRAETKSNFKDRLKQKAQQLFPRAEITLATADALLIAEYCRRRYR